MAGQTAASSPAVTPMSARAHGWEAPKITASDMAPTAQVSVNSHTPLGGRLSAALTACSMASGRVRGSSTAR